MVLSLVEVEDRRRERKRLGCKHRASQSGGRMRRQAPAASAAFLVPTPAPSPTLPRPLKHPISMNILPYTPLAEGNLEEEDLPRPNCDDKTPINSKIVVGFTRSSQAMFSHGSLSPFWWQMEIVCFSTVTWPAGPTWRKIRREVRKSYNKLMDVGRSGHLDSDLRVVLWPWWCRESLRLVFIVRKVSLQWRTAMFTSCGGGGSGGGLARWQGSGCLCEGLLIKRRLFSSQCWARARVGNQPLLLLRLDTVFWEATDW